LPRGAIVLTRSWGLQFAFDPFGKMFEDKKAAEDARGGLGVLAVATTVLNMLRAEAADQAVDNQALSPLQTKLNWYADNIHVLTNATSGLANRSSVLVSCCQQLLVTTSACAVLTYCHL